MDKRSSCEIKLDFPVQLADRSLETISMRRPTIGDILKHKIGANSGLKKDIAFYADLCGLVPDEMERLDSVDYDKIQTQFFRFRGVTLDK